MKRVRIFLSWCHRDKLLKDALAVHLMPALSLFSDLKVEWWQDSHLTCGEDLLPGVVDRIDEADFGLLLLSTPYFGSAFIRKYELCRFAGAGADKGSLPVALSALPEFGDHHDLGGVEKQIVFFADGGQTFADLSGARRRKFANDLAASIRRRVLDLNGYRPL